MFPTILNILGPLLPYLIVFVGIVALYFGIKNKGKLEERAKVQDQVIKQQEKVIEAVAKDVTVNQSVNQKVAEVKAKNEEAKQAVTTSDLKPGDRFEF